MDRINMSSLKDYQLYLLQGPAVKEFLQGQLCSDINVLMEDEPQLTGICNAKGRLVASPYIILKGEKYYIAFAMGMAEITLKYWKPYLMISRTQMNLINSIDCPLEHLFSWEYLMDNKMILIQPETSKQFMPITLGYEDFGALSFNKGCYVGQEILARIHFKGSVKKQVVTIALPKLSLLEPNQIILNNNNKTVGHIAMTPDKKNEIKSTLAIIQKAALESHLKLENNMVIEILL